VAVLVVAAVVVAIVTQRGDSSAEQTPGPAATVVLPSPTPTVAPVARHATTAFAKALPTTVLQYALKTSVPNDDWVKAGAIEAYTETYTDGGAGTVTVLSGQFETADAATAFAKKLVAALPTTTATAAPTASPTPALPTSGDVLVGGKKAGTYTIVDAGDGTGVAVWTNGTTVFRAIAPVADVANVYAAFPL
jgi:hypothetical protein